MTDPELGSPPDDPPVLTLIAAVTGPEAAQAVRALRERHPATRFAVVVTPDLGDELEAVLEALASVRAEVVCADALASSVPSGAETALRLVGRVVGEDFMFTVPDLAEAVSYAINRTRPDDEAHWGGQAVLVVGPPAVLAAARGGSDQ